MRKVPIGKLYGYKLCSEHFEDSQFMNAEEKKKLVWNAVPTIFDIPNPPRKVTLERTPKQRSTEKNVATGDTQEKKETKPETPRKKILKRKICQLRSKLHRMQKQLKKKEKPKTERIVSQLKSHGLSDTTLAFIEGQLKLAQRQKNGYRYAIKDKMLALSIYYQSRKAYKLLRKIFILPSKPTIQRSLQNTNIYPGFNDTIFEALKLKVQTMDYTDRNVSLVFDEMAIKSALVYNKGLDMIEGFENLGELGTTKYIADHALVYMVRGLYKKWKQPLAYFLTSGTVKGKALQLLTKQCIDKLEEIGLCVKILVCDQGSNNRNFLETEEKVGVEKPFIEHKNKKVYVVYDPPHLLKNVRNNLKKGDLSLGDQSVSWQYIEAFYNFDKDMKIRMAPKLTERHISLPPFTSMRVSLAAQVLSHTVAAGINALASEAINKLPIDATVTAEFIDTFDQLFNVFNSSSQFSTQKYRTPFKGESEHLSFLQGCMKFLAKIKNAAGKSLPCIIGWQISIAALLSLWEELKLAGFQYLLTNRLNQDCCENLFSIIRGRGGFRDNPNPQQFRADFRHIVVDKLFVKSNTSNCELDSDRVLLDISSMTIYQKKEKCIQSPEEIPRGAVEMLKVAAPPLSLPEKNVAAYISGYLLRKYPIDNCESCFQFYQLSEKPDTFPESSSYEFIRQKNISSIGKLLIPSKAFSTFIESIETLFVAVFPSCMHLTSVLQSLVKNAVCEIEKFENCEDKTCQSRIRSMTEHFMKVRIYHALKMSNITSYQCFGHKRNRKMLKLLHE